MLVSVIIPTYNRAGTIERAIESVLAQSWKPIEIIVVDSHSTDGTMEILTAYGDRLRLILQQRQGPALAKNAGIHAARGEIIAFLDSDDSWLPDKTERQVRLLQATRSSGVVCCVCNARMEFARQTVYSFGVAGLVPQRQEGIWTNPAEVLTTRFLFFNQVVAVWREALERSGYFNQGIMEDYDLALRLSLLGPWAFVAEPLVIWHEQVADSLTRATNELQRCVRTVEILQSVRDSKLFGPLLPQDLLHHRMWFLEQRIEALRMSAQARPIAGLFAMLRLKYLQFYEVLDRRLPATPRMITRDV